MDEKKRLPQQTTKKIKVIGTQEYINASTGELVEMQVTDIEERDFNFHKVWLRNFVSTLEIIGNEKIKLCFWIIDNLDKDNKLVYTQRQISELSGIGLQTVNRTLKLLREADFLRKMNQSVHVVNPSIIYKGTRGARMNLLNVYHDIDNEKAASDVQKLADLRKAAESIEKQIKLLSEKLNGSTP
jgi:DNA-binding transcriptional regulator YhcF (GntR family)